MRMYAQTMTSMFIMSVLNEIIARRVVAGAAAALKVEARLWICCKQFGSGMLKI